MKASVLILFFVLLFVQCQQSKEYIQPERRKLVEAVYASGKVKAVDQYQVFSTLGGLVNQVFVQEGDTLDVNTPILSLQSSNAALNIENADVSLAILKEEASAQKGRLYELGLQAQMAKNKYQFDSALLAKQQRLWAQNIGSGINLEQQELAANQSYKQWKQAESAHLFAANQHRAEMQKASNLLQMQMNNAQDLLVRSATQGKLYFLNKKLGEMVLPQEPVALIGKADDFLIELQVDEQDISKIRVGQKVLINLESYPNQVFEAQIQRIIPYMKEANKSFEVEALFIQKPKVLYPNLSLEANIIIQEIEDALCLPKKILKANDKVITLKGDTLQLELGAQSMEWVQILSGATESDQFLKP